MSADTYCVYQLENEWGEPLYVGCTKRPWARYRSHLTTATATHRGIRASNFQKDKIISRMLSAKMRPAFVTIEDNLDRTSAFNREIETISKIGRRCLGTWTLTNVGDGGWWNSTIDGERADLWLVKTLGTTPELARETNAGAKTIAAINLGVTLDRALATGAEHRAARLTANVVAWVHETIGEATVTAAGHRTQQSATAEPPQRADNRKAGTS